MAALQNALPADQLSPIIANLEEMRVHLFTSDAWRSFFIVTIGTLLLLAYNAKKLKATWTVAAIALLCLGDMWSVNKRYLYDEQFIPKSEQTATFRKTQTDELILQDPSLVYHFLITAKLCSMITAYALVPIRGIVFFKCIARKVQYTIIQ